MRILWAALVVCCSAAFALAAVGDVDLTFAGTGKTQIAFGGGVDNFAGMIIQSDGKMIVASSAGADINITRYNTDGSRDNSFGNNGRITTRVGLSSSAVGMVRQSDDKFIIAGSAFISAVELDNVLLRYNADGSPDSSFDGDGIVTTNVGSPGAATAITLQSDGKIIVVGASATFRYASNGGLDGTFGGGTGMVNVGGSCAAVQGDGKIIIIGSACGTFSCSMTITRLTSTGTPDGTTFQSASTGSFSSGSVVAIQPGGINVNNPDKIVIGGSSLSGAFIVRYNLDGNVDTTLNGSGVVFVGSGIGAVNALGFSIDVNGAATRIYAAGRLSQQNTGDDFVIARLLINGTPDSAFDGDGIAITPVSTGAGSDAAKSLGFRSGTVTLAGSTGDDVGIARYLTSNGSLDSSLDSDGLKTDDVGDLVAHARGIGYQSTGKMIVAGYLNGASDFALARLNADGSLDSSFGTNGKTLVTNGGVVANGFAIQPDDRIILVGTNSTGGGSFLVMRFDANGQSDTTFNGDGDNDGKTLTAMGVSNSTAYGVAVQPDGGIIVVGDASNGSNLDFAVLRLTTTGAPDNTFDSDGKVLIPVGAGSDQARVVSIQPDGKILVAGFYSNGSNNDFAIVRCTTVGGLDFSFSGDGKQVTGIGSGNDEAYAMALQPDGKIVLAGRSFSGVNNDFALVRYLSNGTPDSSFDGDGKVTTEVGAEESVEAVRVLPDGKILAAGYSFTGVTNDFAVVRYTSLGTPDSNFGSGGQMVVDFGNSSDDFGYAMSIDNIGRITLAGDAGNFFGVARLLGDPFLKINSIAKSGMTVSLQGLGVPGLTNHIETSLDLSPNSFSLAMNVTPDASGFWQQDLASSATKQFYRLTYP